jgi:hypothetical protein
MWNVSVARIGTKCISYVPYYFFRSWFHPLCASLLSEEGWLKRVSTYLYNTTKLIVSIAS